jgi:WhiB family redox-sensing transcriptional regulator
VVDADPVEWELRAACRGYPTEWWYAEADPDHYLPSGERAMSNPQEKAIAVCMRCPVRRECMKHALTWPERHGIWGGATEQIRTRHTPKMFADIDEIVDLLIRAATNRAADCGIIPIYRKELSA